MYMYMYMYMYIHLCLILQEGKELLGDEELEKTRSQTEAVKEVIEKSSPEKPHIPRDNTMVVTAQVSESERERKREREREREGEREREFSLLRGGGGGADGGAHGFPTPN